MFYSYREQNDQTPDMAYSLYNFRNINMPPVSRETTITPPYRFNSPLIVSSVPDPQFRNYTATNPLSADVSSFNEAQTTYSPLPMLQHFNPSFQHNQLSNLLFSVLY